MNLELFCENFVEIIFKWVAFKWFIDVNIFRSYC